VVKYARVSLLAGKLEASAVGSFAKSRFTAIKVRTSAVRLRKYSKKKSKGERQRFCKNCMSL